VCTGAGVPEVLRVPWAHGVRTCTALCHRLDEQGALLITPEGPVQAQACLQAFSQHQVLPLH